jgi:hypothetical protein
MERMSRMSGVACALAFAAGVALPALADSRGFAGDRPALVARVETGRTPPAPTLSPAVPTTAPDGPQRPSAP